MATIPIRPKDAPDAAIGDSDRIPFDGTPGLRSAAWSAIKTAIAAAFTAAPNTFKVATLDGSNKIPVGQLPTGYPGAYLGTVAGASVPSAAGKAPGDYYRISSAGTSQSVTWAGGDLAIVNAAANGWDRSAEATNLFLLSKDEIMSRIANRVPRGGLRFTGGAADFLQAASGTNFGTGDFTACGVIQLDDYTPSSAFTALLFGSHSAGNNRVQVRLTTGGTFQIEFFDNAGAQTNYVLTPDVALADGETYFWGITFDRDGLATLYINGDPDRDANTTQVTVSIAGSSAVDIGSGNANGWIIGYTTTGVVDAIRPFNRLMTAAEILKLARTGVVDFSDQWGSTTAKYSSDFSAGLDGWAANGGIGSTVTNNGNIDTDADGAGIPPTKDWQRTKRTDAAAGQIGFFVSSSQASSALSVGKRYLITADIFVPSGSPVTHVKLEGYNAALIQSYGVKSVTAGAVNSLSWETTAAPHLEGPWIRACDSGGTAVSVAQNTAIYLKAYKSVAIGCVGDPDCHNADPAQSLTVKDRSSNANDLTVQGTVTNTVQVRRNQQLNPVQLTIGGGAVIKKLLSATAALDFGSIAAGASADLTITVTGAAVGDAVAIGLPAAPAAGIVFFGFVSATNTVTVRAMNITGSNVDPASATYRATVLQF